MKYSLVVNAVIQAYGKEQISVGLIVHTDQNSQFTGYNFRSILAKFGAIHSNSRKRNPYDNAVIEYFYKIIKRELILDAK